MCEWGHGRCTAPNTICPHWIGAICELDAAFYNFENVRCPKKPEGGGEEHCWGEYRATYCDCCGAIMDLMEG